MLHPRASHSGTNIGRRPLSDGVTKQNSDQNLNIVYVNNPLQNSKSPSTTEDYFKFLSPN